MGAVQTTLHYTGLNSYLSDIVQSVHTNGCMSPACPLTCVVSQDSVLGPQLFSIFAAPLLKITLNDNCMSHSHDTPIYITVKPHQEDIDAVVDCIERCVTEIRI